MLSAQENPAANTNYEILMSIDGFPASAMDEENILLPTIRELIREVVYAKKMIPLHLPAYGRSSTGFWDILQKQELLKKA